MGVLGKGKELAHFGFADGLCGIVFADATTGGNYIVKTGTFRRSDGLTGACAHQLDKQNAKEEKLDGELK